jgi:hypothetical protein
MQVMTHAKAFEIHFFHGEDEEVTKVHADDQEVALKYFGFFFPDAILIEIKESIVQILITDLEPN